VKGGQEMVRIQDKESYSLVVEEFSDMLFRIAYQNVFNIPDAEDIVQDVYVKLLKRKHITFKDKEHLKAWLIRVTVNQCIDYKRGLQRNREMPLEEANESDFGFTGEENTIFEQLSELPKMDRNILYLYYYEGYHIKEIARLLKKRQNTVNSRLTRARNKLKSILLEEY